MYRHYRFPYQAMLVLVFFTYAFYKLVYSPNEAEFFWRHSPVTMWKYFTIGCVFFIQACFYYAFQTHIFSKKLARLHISFLFTSNVLFPVTIYFLQPSGADQIEYASKSADFFETVGYLNLAAGIVALAAHTLFIINMARSWRLPPNRITAEEGLLDEFHTQR